MIALMQDVKDCPRGWRLVRVALLSAVAGWALSIHRLPSVVFQRSPRPASVGRTLTIHRLPSVVFVVSQLRITDSVSRLFPESVGVLEWGASPLGMGTANSRS
jgi:hypothetical protein